MRLIAVAIVIALFPFVAHSGDAPHKALPKISTEQRAKQLLAAFKDQLNDPFSAKFRRLAFSDKGFLCGEVNAKNLQGAYAGWKVFWTNGGPEMERITGGVADGQLRHSGNIGIAGGGTFDESFPHRTQTCENLKPVKVKMEGVIANE